MPAPRFFCDDHLRRLARWLRAAGFDAAWQAAIPDRELVERARREDRLILTLDRGLVERRGAKACLLPSHDPLEQLRYLKRRFALDLLADAFTRCPVCNVPLEECEPDPAVPARVREACDRFWRCPSCTRSYWEGDHVRHMRERFRAV